LRRTLVADGNFSADHIKMKMPDDDVKLTNGSGYMVEEQQFKEHLANAMEIKQVRNSLLNILMNFIDTIKNTTCRNYRAMAAAKSNQKNLDSTGIGACACGRHGCFVPHCIVPFQKGERFEHISLTLFFLIECC
jgi:hypothetical protein